MVREILFLPARFFFLSPAARPRRSALAALPRARRTAARRGLVTSVRRPGVLVVARIRRRGLALHSVSSRVVDAEPSVLDDFPAAAARAALLVRRASRLFRRSLYLLGVLLG
eukprot:15620-Pelagococcus_subviridis.AAC.1